MSESAKHDPFSDVARDPDAPSPAPAAPEPVRAFLTFRLRGHWYALPAATVREVVPYAEPVPVPGVPGFVGGVINHSGRIVVVLDLGAVLGLGRGTPDPMQRCLILEAEGQPVAARVDAVHSIVEVGASKLTAAGESGGAGHQTFSDEERVVTVLELGALLARAEGQIAARTEGAWSS